MACWAWAFRTMTIQLSKKSWASKAVTSPKIRLIGRLQPNVSPASAYIPACGVGVCLPAILRNRLTGSSNSNVVVLRSLANWRRCLARTPPATRISLPGVAFSSGTAFCVRDLTGDHRRRETVSIPSLVGGSVCPLARMLDPSISISVASCRSRARYVRSST